MKPLQIKPTNEVQDKSDISAVTEEVSEAVLNIIIEHEKMVEISLLILVFNVDHRNGSTFIRLQEEISERAASLFNVVTCCTDIVDLSEDKDIRECYKEFMRYQMYSNVLQQLEINRTKIHFFYGFHNEETSERLTVEESGKIMAQVSKISRALWEKVNESRQRYEKLISTMNHPLAS